MPTRQELFNKALLESAAGESDNLRYLYPSRSIPRLLHVIIGMQCEAVESRWANVAAWLNELYEATSAELRSLVTAAANNNKRAYVDKLMEDKDGPDGACDSLFHKTWVYAQALIARRADVMMWFVLTQTRPDPGMASDVSFGLDDLFLCYPEVALFFGPCGDFRDLFLHSVSTCASDPQVYGLLRTRLTQATAHFPALEASEKDFAVVNTSRRENIRKVLA